MNDGHDGEENPILAYDDDSRHDQVDTARYPLMAEAIRELLIEKGAVKAGDVREHLESMDERDPADGARIIAKAWTDPAFKTLLMEDGNAAVETLDLTMADAVLVVVENTDKVHNMIVCTLCSCYPRTILGMPPDWYKSKDYRRRVVNQPRQVLREFGTEIADDVVVRVHDSNADMRYLVLPARPRGTEGWSESDLAKLVGRDCMIGVTRPEAPGKNAA